MPHTQRIAVIGAGPAGLFATHLLAQQGYAVALFESHGKPGGCASYFRRQTPAGPVTFDAGATVLNTLSPGGFLDRLLRHCGVSLGDNAFERHAVDFALENHPRFSLAIADFPSFEASLADAFPADRAALTLFFDRYRAPAQALMAALPHIPHLPIQSWQDLRLNAPLLSFAPPLLRELYRSGDNSFHDVLKNFGFSEIFHRWVNMNLLITLQCRATDVFPLVGVLGLYFYLLDAGALRGGMRSFFDPLLTGLESKAKVFMRTAISGIEKRDGFFYLHKSQATTKKASPITESEIGPFDIVVSSIPRYNTQKLFHGPSPFRADESWEKLRHEVWGAGVAYLAVQDVPAFPATAFNAHTQQNKQEIYLSFSARDELRRAPHGLRAVTLSSHTPWGDWFSGEGRRADYVAHKAAFGESLVAAFRSLYPSSEILFRDFGAPPSFLRYTRREGGGVGGLPQTKAHSLWNAPSQRSFIEGLYQIGDTSFPGQSILACAIGACGVVEKITGHKLSIN